MEDKKLNFDQPFLSVRRASPAGKDDPMKHAGVCSVIPRLPLYRSELKSGPVSNPGAVPFHWEQTPGQPKDERQQNNLNLDRPPIVPKIPPGRFSNESHQDYTKCALQDANVGNSEDSKEKTEEGECSESSESTCDEFTDAQDALSRTESFFFNCSVSDFSEIDNLDVMKMKQSESFLSNLKTRELMMDRFLPAAKAMASEAPFYAHKKQHSAVKEQPQQLRKILMQNQPSLRYEPSFADRYPHYHDCEEVSDEDYDQPELSATCGLLHRISLKNSLYCLLNPVPAMKIRSCLPASPFSKVQPRSSSSGSYSETENELKSDISESRPVDKSQIAELKETRSRLRDELCHNDSTYLDPPASFLEDEQVLRIDEETKNPMINGNRLHKNGRKTFRDFLADHDHDSQNKEDSEYLVVEKTLYVDTIYKMESQDNLLSPRTHVMKSLNQIHFTSSSSEDFKMDSMDAEGTSFPVTEKFESMIGNSNVKSEMEETGTLGDAKNVELHSPAENKQVTEKVSLQTSTVIQPHVLSYEFPVPPPSLQSPSDSWLSRTLPTSSRKTLPRHLSLAEQPKVRENNSTRHPQEMSNGNAEIYT